ncbi:MAG TPA: prolipoprotein diacylglyceryl transferase family protein [Bryobacteraceae bacterium]|nr:prolipoprotein diacylglyceryl transferase family protein [Bryobacteraceae bacterium]
MSPFLAGPSGAVVPLYAPLMALGGFLLGIVAVRAGERCQVRRDHVLGLFLVAWLAGWAGARLWFVVEHRQYLESSLGRWVLDPAFGGFSSYGGLLAGLAGGALYGHLMRLPLRRLADAVAPGLCLFGVAARFGCFFAGCCHGRPAALPWAVSAAPGSPAARRFGDGATLHPAQLYEAAAVALIGWFAARRPSEVSGGTFLRVAASYCLARLLLDRFRGDARADGDVLSVAQWTSLAVLAVAAALMWRGRSAWRGAGSRC